MNLSTDSLLHIETNKNVNNRVGKRLYVLSITKCVPCPYSVKK